MAQIWTSISQRWDSIDFHLSIDSPKLYIGAPELSVIIMVQIKLLIYDALHLID